MYQWWVFIHIVGVVGFLLAHGVSVTVLFALRRERDPDRIRALLALSGQSTTAFYWSFLVLLGGGLAAATWGSAYVVLSLPVLSRVLKFSVDWRRARRLLMFATAGLAADILLKSLLAPAWHRLLLRAAGW